MNDYKKNLIKGLKALVYVLVSGIAVEYGNYEVYTLVGPILAMIVDYLKHKE